jgi:hypothetical protein
MVTRTAVCRLVRVGVSGLALAEKEPHVEKAKSARRRSSDTVFYVVSESFFSDSLLYRVRVRRTSGQCSAAHCFRLSEDRTTSRVFRNYHEYSSWFSQQDLPRVAN